MPTIYPYNVIYFVKRPSCVLHEFYQKYKRMGHIIMWQLHGMKWKVHKNELSHMSQERSYLDGWIFNPVFSWCMSTIAPNLIRIGSPEAGLRAYYYATPPRYVKWIVHKMKNRPYFGNEETYMNESFTQHSYGVYAHTCQIWSGLVLYEPKRTHIISLDTSPVQKENE